MTDSPKPPRVPQWTKAETQRFLREAYTNRVAWLAARVLLERAEQVIAQVELEHVELAEERAAVLASIQTFLERHPAPPALASAPKEADGGG